MRKYLTITIILMVTTLLYACGTKTYEEAFRDAHPSAEILHEIKIQKGIVILYREKQSVGAAQLSPEGNRWNVVSSNNIVDNDSISFGLINKGADDEILFGRINDGEIAKVQLQKEYGEVIEATILEPKKSIWYLQWEYDNAELIGLSKDGAILYQSTFRK
ncbi:hypothetical protein [Paenibacillus beijingensis]|uniref:Uncharacterized protein n=1 Tax=Paenibacillus beijingensis TaxID=1126833 RepID=A0A0D5NFJ7_9BACL|nr:hypothetical protein [Paenibacillus beijingensis]AJY74041.1 hypothetical protein VN24_04755 [Paenibacillus beijingensis]